MKRIEFEEKKVYSLDKAPEDPELFFEYCIKIFSSYQIVMGTLLNVD